MAIMKSYCCWHSFPSMTSWNFIFLLVIGWTLTMTFGQELIDDDTVLLQGIEGDEEINQFLRVKRETIKGPDGSTVTINCKTARNENGHCKPFGECYPLFRLRNVDLEYEEEKRLEKKRRQSPSYELESIYRNVSGPCSEELLSQISKVVVGKDISTQEYVCCPVERDLLRSRPSNRPPSNSYPLNTVKNHCGRLYVRYKADEGNFTGAEDINKETLDENTTQLPTFDDDEVVGRIVNGHEVRRGEYPWTVALMNRGRQFCGASLISERHILTAAHCVFFMNRQDVSRMTIHIGDHNLYSSADGSHQVRTASNIYYHKGFSMKTLYDDISVIRLSSPIKFDRYIQPVCLHNGSPKYDSGNMKADVAGWGQVSVSGPQVSILRAVQVRVMAQTECANKYKGYAPAGIVPGMVCAGDRGYDSCKGDSGGPLTINSRSQATQIGVVSWGIGCGSFPGVYTRVDKYLPWINKNRR